MARTDVHSYGQFDTGAALQNQRQQRQDVPQQNTPLTSPVAGCCGAKILDVRLRLRHSPEMAEVKIAMISSTVRNLPDHREKARDACLRQGFFPSMMENWPAMDADGVTASLEKVEKADVYIGVFGFRYGYVPDGSEISVTEMEYNRAVEREIPRLIFLMDEEHTVTVQEVERGPNAEKLDNLRSRLKSERTVSLFKSPEDLLAKAIDSLSNLKRDHAIPTTPVQMPVTSYDPRYPIFFVPFRAKGNQVVGRGAALEAVRNQLERGHRTAIGQTASFAGLGGLGKTQLAVEYAYSFRDQYPNGVIWISADQDIDRHPGDLSVARRRAFHHELCRRRFHSDPSFRAIGGDAGRKGGGRQRAGNAVAAHGVSDFRRTAGFVVLPVQRRRAGRLLV